MKEKAPISLVSKLIVAGMLLIGFTGAAIFIWLRMSESKVDGFYHVHAQRIDTTSTELLHFWTVRVDSYDSLKVVRVADQLVEESMLKNKLRYNNRRRYLLHFFTPSDTVQLSADQIADLQYEHPGDTNLQSEYQAIRNGFVIGAMFAPSAASPIKTEINRQAFVIRRR